MQAVILAAGEGRRMRPLTSHLPKVMLPIANVPILEHVLSQARDAGCEEIVLVVGYGEESVREHFKDGSAFGLSISYAPQRKQRGTADALLAASHLLEDPFLLLNGDALLRAEDLRAMLAAEPPVLATARSDHPWDYGAVEVEGGHVTSLREKEAAPSTQLVNAGVYLLGADIVPILSSLTPSPRGELELTDALLHYIRERGLAAFALSYWRDIGHPWDLLDANAEALAELRSVREGVVEEGVVLKGRVSIGRESTIRSGTYIEGPCIIGNDCVVGPHAYIRGSTSIGDGCHVGHCTELKNTILMAGTKLPHFNYAGDSVIGRRCNLGAGTKIANLRHDRREVLAGGKSTGKVKFGAIIGDDVKLGINCSVNAGSVLGSGTIAAPGAIIEGTYGEGSVVR
ncbi:MAG: sugar phosphate nucleotidyltransferase [Methanomicrobiales archaeon]|nr:sugar phosphate nucleotidyltransferase [Methanomicrobiales archaeon]